MAILLAITTLLVQNVRAADILWDGSPTGNGTVWTTAANWAGDAVPTSADNAIFGSSNAVTLYTLNNTSQQVGSITVGSDRPNSFSIRSFSSASGTLVLNGVGGILLSNASPTAGLTFTNSSTVGSIMSLTLAASGDIYCGGTGAAAGRIVVYSSIGESGGSRNITKTGPGSLRLWGVNSYSGNTTVTAGDLEMDDAGTIGNGAGTLFLSGGNLLSGASRNGTSTTSISNAIVITQDAYVQNKAGTASPRFMALSGSLGGSAGTLKIANPTTTPGNTFTPRLLGSFTFNRPMIVGEAGYDLASAFTVLELGNTNGTQTFNGNISGVGSIRRLNIYSSGSPAGATVFTGSNSYSGGTLISGGTLFANNSTGSALGSGAVTVTNKGILAGNGTVVASTALNLDGTISPGSTSNGIANLAVSDLTFNPGGNYVWQITNSTGVAGTAWDLITCSSGWTDAVGAGSPVTIKVDSLGAVPTGWASGTARDWVIIQSSSATGFDDSHFAIDTTSFSGTVAGIFNLTNVSGALHLRYTPAGDTVINVPSGSQTQGGVSPTPYPLLTGVVGVIKVGNGEVVLTNSLNDYQGSTKIYAGTASAAVDALNGSPSAFGDSSSALLLGNTLGNSNATLNISVAGVTVARSVVVQSGSSGAKTIGTTITSGAATYSGDVALQDSATLSAAAGGSASFSGNFTGSGGLTFSGGTITLSAVNSYAGPSALTGGTLNLNAKALGTNTFTISAVSTLDNTSAASVTLNDCPQNWNANFTFTGTTNLNLGGGPVTMSATRTLTVNNSTLTVGGAISGSAGLVKLGAGTLALAGATSSTYTGGTTNSAGVLALNGTATLGDATGTLVLNGGNILSTGTRSGLPVSNSVVMTTSATIYGNSTASAPSTRILPFSGSWTVSSGTLRIGNTGLSNNTFTARFTAGSDVNYPVIVGDPAFDTPGAICEFQLYNDNTTPVQAVSGLISGNGQVWRGHLTSGAGGTSVFTGNNTHSGGTVLDSGTLGIGLDSTPTSGVVTSGPLGTGTFEIDNDPSIHIYASGGARTIGNHVFLNGVTNVVVTGTNALTFTGEVDLGGVTKTLTVSNTALTTFSGFLSNSAALIKAGPGRLVFTGDNSARTNTTTVNDGTLLVNNTAGSGTGSGAVIVTAPGVLGGSGTIAGAVSGSGDISPGQSAGALTLGDGLDLNSGGTYVWELAANATNSPGTNFDVLPVTGGNLFLGGSSKLSINFIGTAIAPSATNAFWQSARQWTIIALSGTATNIGPTVFPTIINGTNAAGYFTNFADVNGGIVLQFIPSAVAPTPPPQPVISPAIVGANTASATISWSATNGYTYTVQYKTNLTQPTWDTLGTSTATGSTASFNDTTGPRKQTFYRVIWP